MKVKKVLEQVLKLVSLATLNTYLVYIAVSVNITGSTNTPMLGLNYTLFCNVYGAIVTTYQWIKNGTLLAETNSALSFRSLQLSNSSQYTCTVTENLTSYSASKNITLQS